MKQYEYLTLEVEWTDPTVIRYKRQIPGQGGYNLPDTNDLGKEGWELIQFLNHLQTRALVAIFKREIPRQGAD